MFMKKAFKALLFVALFVILFLMGMGLAMINNEGNVELPEIKIPHISYQSPSDDVVKPLGRSYYDGSVRYFSMSGGGAEFTFKGDYAELTLLCDDAESMVTHHQPRIAILLNCLDQLFGSHHQY